MTHSSVYINTCINIRREGKMGEDRKRGGELRFGGGEAAREMSRWT